MFEILSRLLINCLDTLDELALTKRWCWVIVPLSIFGVQVLNLAITLELVFCLGFSKFMICSKFCFCIFITWRWYSVSHSPNSYCYAVNFVFFKGDIWRIKCWPEEFFLVTFILFYHMLRKASPKKLSLKVFYSQAGGYGSQFHEHLKTEPGLHFHC